MNDKWDMLWINATLASCESKDHLQKKGAIAIRGDKIAWMGNMDALPANHEKTVTKVIDAKGRLITPGFVDCHTHLIYAGSRANEYAERLQGKTYTEIAKAGGGILATVAKTRKASLETLVEESLPRLQALMQSGVTTVEIKSGYGLDVNTEIKMLEAANILAEKLPVTIKRTFLGAHTVPAEFQGFNDKYVHFICHEMIPRIAEEKLGDAVDVFCETIAFDLAQTERVFQEATSFHLKVKCHAEQLSKTGAAQLAAKYHALSVDHLEHIDEAGVSAIAEAKTVAVLLPGSFYFLKETKVPPIALLRKYKVPMAVASDCNPGTSPITSMLIVLNMACTLYNLTIEEALQGATLNAAKALGMELTHGSLKVGKYADLALWEVKDPADLIYYLGSTPLKQLIKNGQEVFMRCNE